MEILRNTVTTSRTIVDQKDRLAAALKSTATVAGTAEDFLDANGDRLITLGRVSRPTLELFARYSPQYPCLLAGLVRQEKASEEAFKGGKMHITLEVVRPQGAYEPGEEPRYGERSAPTAVICRTLRCRRPAPTSTTVPRGRVRPRAVRWASPPPGPSSGLSARSWRRCWACPPTRCRRSRRCCSGRWRAGRR